MLTAVTVVTVACLVLIGWVAFLNKKAELVESLILFDGHEVNKNEFDAVMQLLHNQVITSAQARIYLGIHPGHE